MAFEVLQPLVVANTITDAVRLAGIEGDGRPAEGSTGVWPGTTNLALYSNDFSNAATWPDVSGGGATRTRDVADVYGNIQGWTLSTASVSGMALRQVINVVAGQTYTWTFWSMRGTVTAQNYSIYDVTHSAEIIAPTSYYSQVNATTWSKITVTFTVPAGCTQVGCYVQRGGPPGTLKVWRAQLENKAYATPYVATTTATATRNAARAQMDAALLSAQQGAVVIRARMGWAAAADIHNPNVAAFFEWGDDVNNRFAMTTTGATGKLRVQRRNTGGIQDSVATGPVAWTSRDETFTGAFGWSPTNLYVGANGNPFVTVAGTPFIPALAATLFDIGDGVANPALQPLAGDVLWLATFPRALTDAEFARIHQRLIQPPEPRHPADIGFFP